MTVASELNRVTYVGNGATTAFAVSFPFQNKADLVVIETVIATGVQTTKTLTTHYTISGTTDSLGYYANGGTVTAVTAPASTVRWTIYRDPPLLQSLNLGENNALPAESLEAQLDYVTMLVQRLNDVMGRSLRQPDGDSADIDYLPSKVDRASTYLAFDADGDPIATSGTTSVIVTTPYIETLLDDATAAVARATLGAVGLTGDETIAGAKTFSSAIPSPTLTAPTMTSPTVSSGALTLTSGQIAFPATQAASANANTLDDYEEGSWTPSSGGTATYNYQQGSYVKVGKIVVARCRLAINVIGTGATSQILGLPFTSAATFAMPGSAYFFTLSTNVVTVVPMVAASGTTIDLYSQAAAGTGLAQSAIIGNSTTLHVTVVYEAAS